MKTWDKEFPENSGHQLRIVINGSLGNFMESHTIHMANGKRIRNSTIQRLSKKDLIEIRDFLNINIKD